MKPINENAAPRGPHQSTQRPSTEIPSISVFDFPISVNQFQSLQDSQPAVSTGQVHSEDRLINPRGTRLARLQAARGTAE